MRVSVTVPVCLAAGVGAGFLAFKGPPPMTRAAAAVLREKELTTDAAAWPDSPIATDAKTQRLLAACLRQGGSNERENEMYLAVQAFTAQDFNRLIGDAGALKAMAETLRGIEGPIGQNLASALIGRWLTVDPQTVLTWAPRVLELIPAKEDARGWILDALAARRPEEMLALVPARKDAADRANIISRGMRELAARNLRKAEAWLSGCTDPADRRVAEKALHLGMVKTEPLRAIELAGSIENRQEGYELLNAAAESAANMGPEMLRRLAATPMKSWMLSSVLSEFADREPGEAVDLAVDLAVKSVTDGKNDNDGNFGLQAAFSALARSDPAQCVAKLEGLSGPERAAAVSAIGYAWAAREPAQALNWLAERPVSERVDPHRGSYGSNDALLMAFSAWAGNTPDKARAWADALPAGATRDSVQSRFALSLTERGEPAEATQVLARLGRNADPKAVANTAAIWARRDPQAAADWAVAQEAGPAQSRALASIVSTWANDNPDGVGDWLAQFPAGEARDRSVSAFLQRSTAGTANREERIAELDAWFDLIDDPWRRTQVARSSFWERKQRDPAGARAWLSALPNVDPEVVRMMLRDNSD